MTKNFHWHAYRSHNRNDHLLLVEQARQIYQSADLIIECAHMLGGMAIASIRHVARLQRLCDLSRLPLGQ